MTGFEKQERQFISNDLTFNWKNIEPYYQELAERELGDLKALKQWLQDRSELNAVLEEEFAWRYIRMNIETENEAYQKAFQQFVQEINPKIAPFEDKLNRKLNDSKVSDQLTDKDYQNLLKATHNQIELFREKNIPIFTQLEEDSQKFGALAAKMSIQYKGREYTLQQAANFLKSTDREARKEVYHLIWEQRSKHINEVDELFDHLIKLRRQVAQNADFENYRDYKFKAMGRFDYTVDDCEEFHRSIQKAAVPLTRKIDNKRKDALELDVLKPWDTSIDIRGEEPLKPFDGGEDLLAKSIQCFDRIDPFFGDCLREMRDKKHLDLDSKKGKAPGGFNYPLYESGLPFIFMNAVGSMRDVTTMLHEGGHAIHSVLSHPLELVDFKSMPSEVAELASMSMELISMDHWDVFFKDEKELKRAKRDQLLDVTQTLPWVATIDKFQHWVYTHPEHSHKERCDYWESLMDEFGSELINWKGLKAARRNLWQKQLHLFEVPFYYIEYGMAQLGAIAMWRNFKKDPEQTIANYKKALSLGYTRSIGEIYETAGIKFDFSADYVSSLINFVEEELDKTFID
ncbi:MAG: M3 family oligoendopeptidase [Vicingaceae bacterium]